jgi:hypothetical protein
LWWCVGCGAGRFPAARARPHASGVAQPQAVSSGVAVAPVVSPSGGVVPGSVGGVPQPVSLVVSDAPHAVSGGAALVRVAPVTAAAARVSAAIV